MFQSIWLLQLLRMAQEAHGIRLEQRHGKARVRVGRVWRHDHDGSHHFVEWNVSISLLSHCLSSYYRDDNSDIVATDTMKNTVSCPFQLLVIFLWISDQRSMYWLVWVKICLIHGCVTWSSLLPCLVLYFGS